MRKLLLVSIITLTTFSVFGQSTSDTPQQNISTDGNVEYRLFATRNMYTFIKLNTRNGQMCKFNGVQKANIDLRLYYQMFLGLIKKTRRMVDSFYIQQLTSIILFCLIKLTVGLGRYNGEKKQNGL